MPELTNAYDNETILQVIDSALNALGNSPKQAIWIFLESDFNIKREELPKRIREFENGLEKVFKNVTSLEELVRVSAR